jgi:hypothetical protein
MENRIFDRWARLVDGADPTRRRLFTGVSGSALAAVLTRFGGLVVEVPRGVDARKRRKRRRKKRRKKNPCDGGCPPDVPLCCPERCCPTELPICCPHACCPNSPQIACGPTAESPCVLIT